jgi:hypothetical protein
MIGRNPLLVAKEHGHRLTTMLTVYAAWAEGVIEADIAAIREAMNRTTHSSGRVGERAEGRGETVPVQPFPEPSDACPRSGVPAAEAASLPASASPEVSRATSRPPSTGPAALLGSGLVSEPLLWLLKYLKVKDNFGGKGGTRTLDPGIMSLKGTTKT